MGKGTLKIGIVMDPIESITPYKDSSLAMLLEAERRGAEIHYFRQQDLKLLSGDAIGRSQRLHVQDDNSDWFELGSTNELPLGELDVILMRKDPPFDMEYVYTTYILDRAREAGALVVLDCVTSLGGIPGHERESVYRLVSRLHAGNADYALDAGDEGVSCKT